MTDTHFALYRKYRPTRFDEVRNQDHIVRVLEGAISKGKIPHALLFTGPRGTGKTTVARIFAREIGAEDVDIYEIDAASNRSIDDVRELKESVHTVPYASPYKVYIIDEVHMLTKEAFNALLKTLEEPPQYVVFILATTERDKLLDTITSRCQIFEFRAPTREELRETVLAVAKKEKFKLDSGSADLIALSADGSYRDALGITQKVMMASGDSALTEEEVALIVGAPRNVILKDLITAFAKKDIPLGMTALREAEKAGADPRLFMKLLLERFRTIILIRNVGEDEELLRVYSEEDARMLVAYAHDTGSSIHSKLLLRGLELGLYVGKTTQPLLPVELLLIEHGGMA